MAEDPSGKSSDDIRATLRSELERDGAALLRFATVLIGAGPAGRALLVEVLGEAVRGGAGDLERVRLFEGLRRLGALHVDRERRRGAAEGGGRQRPQLSELRPTEREALLLRYVAGLGRSEVAAACGVDDAAVGERLSRGLLHACRSGGAAPDVTPLSSRRRAAEDRLIDLLDGLAPDEVADFAAEDDVTRDLVHDAERKVEWLRALGTDTVADVATLEADVLAGMAQPGIVQAQQRPPVEAVHEEPDGPSPEVASPGTVPMAASPGTAPAAATPGTLPVAAAPGTAPAAVPADTVRAEDPAAKTASGPTRAPALAGRGRLALLAMGAAALNQRS